MANLKIVLVSVFLFTLVIALGSSPAFADGDNQPIQKPIQPVDSKGDPDLPGV